MDQESRLLEWLAGGSAFAAIVGFVIGIPKAWFGLKARVQAVEDKNEAQDQAIERIEDTVVRQHEETQARHTNIEAKLDTLILKLVDGGD